MENLLSSRPAHLILGVVVLLLAMVPAAQRLLPGEPLTPAGIESFCRRQVERCEAELKKRLDAADRRSEEVLGLYRRGSLRHEEMARREGLLVEQNGVVKEYYGEIYYYKIDDAPVTPRRLIRKNDDIFYLRRLAPHVYYVRHFLNLRANFLIRSLQSRFSYVEVQFQPTQSPADEQRFDTNGGRIFHFSRVLREADQQLRIQLSGTPELLSEYMRRRRLLLDGLALLAAALLGVLLLHRARSPLLKGLRVLLWVGVCADALALIGLLWSNDIYLPLGPLRLRSIGQVLAAALILTVLLLRLPRRLLVRRWFLPFFVVWSVVLTYFIDRLLKGADFPIEHFSPAPAYLALVLTLILLLSPALVAGRLLLSPADGRRRRIIVFLMIAVAAALTLSGVLPNPVWLLSALGLPPVFYFRRRMVLRALHVILIALTVTLLTLTYTAAERRTYIADNLKNLFSSQDHFAKLVAREIVYEINAREQSFHALFNLENADELQSIWQNTIAATENIASAICVFDKNGKLLQSYYYRMPPVPINKTDIFPFWHIEDVDAVMFGKNVRLAVATINVVHQGEYLGYLMVQVLNAPQLILTGPVQSSLFALDRKLRHMEPGYVTLGDQYQELENPANINLGDLSRLSRQQGGWFAFSYMGLTYNGYLFRSGERTVIIYYPQYTLFKIFSEFIKLLIFSMLAFSLLYLNRLPGLPWRQLFNTFSLKVFSILIFISILTTVSFTILTLRFNYITQERQFQQSVFEKGRAAQNIINNLIAETGEISQNHLFLVARILNQDIHVYENGVLQFTSDHRQLMRAEIPIYLNSGVRAALDAENRQFELRPQDERQLLYFRIAPAYIFAMEFTHPARAIVPGKEYFTDFIVTMGFFLVAAGLFSALFFKNKILAPIHRLNQGMSAVERGELVPFYDIPSEIELESLFTGFNSMIHGISEQQKSVSEIARMKTLVQLGRRVAHEVKNPLTPIKLSAEQILKSNREGNPRKDQIIEQGVRFIIEETDHLKKVAYGFLDLSRLDELQAETFDYPTLLREEIDSLQSLYETISFRLECAELALALTADRMKIKQVLKNLLNNAVESFAGRSGTITVSVVVEEGWVYTEIRDTGPGIRPEELQKLLDEPYSSKEMGSGLGLFIVKRIVELHKGSLQLDSAENRGTTARFSLPRHGA